VHAPRPLDVIGENGPPPLWLALANSVNSAVGSA
jgi:hypothetical protein